MIVDVRARQVVYGVAAVVGVVATLVVVWPTGGGRTDRILEVYAKRHGLSAEEAQIVRSEALAEAWEICSIEPDDLEARFSQNSLEIEDAIALAEAACPQRAREFIAAVPHQPEIPNTPADLIVTPNPSLNSETTRQLVGRLILIDGVGVVRAASGAFAITLRPGADQAAVTRRIEAVPNVASVHSA